MNPKSDLACERHRADLHVHGVTLKKENCCGFDLETLTITTEEGAASVGRPPGRYLTLSFPSPASLSPQDGEALAEAVAKCLLLLTPAGVQAVLVAGLGNLHLTADALGCLTAEGIHATAHLQREDPALFGTLSCLSLCTVCPGVLAQTGLEAAQTVQAAIATAGAQMALAIDALAARSPARLWRTVQFCDTGIVPGSGIGNARKAIDRESMGVPVLAMGVPTVVDTGTLLADALEKRGLPFSDAEAEESAALFVCPRNADEELRALSRILSAGVNLAYGVVLE